MNKIVISSAGNATCGKDTLFLILRDILTPYNINLERVSFADNLKAEVADFVKSKYNISAFTKDPKEKELIRGIFIEHGRIMRSLTNGKYWTSQVEQRINDILNEGSIAYITDCRYDEYPEDEVFFIKEKFKGKIIYIERVLPNGQLLGYPNKEEEKNNPKIKSKSDYILRWQTCPDFEILKDTVKIQLEPLLDEILGSPESTVEGSLKALETIVNNFNPYEKTNQ